MIENCNDCRRLYKVEVLESSLRIFNGRLETHVMLQTSIGDEEPETLSYVLIDEGNGWKLIGKESNCRIDEALHGEHYKLLRWYVHGVNRNLTDAMNSARYLLNPENFPPIFRVTEESGN